MSQTIILPLGVTHRSGGKSNREFDSPLWQNLLLLKNL